ncbi:MAG: WD40 repeat domain-containing protein [Anaerolineae bacterium]|nr:WD40 repeat domain-containing protein [Anaerolineae bacterium]
MTKNLARIILIGVLSLLVVSGVAYWAALRGPVITYPETLGGKFAILPSGQGTYVYDYNSCHFYIIDKNTVNAPEMYNCVGDFPTWSPNGNQIAFVTSGLWSDKVTVLNPTTLVTQSFEILKENTAGYDQKGNPVSGLAGCRFSRPLWTQDGQRVIVKCELEFVPPDAIRENFTVASKQRIFTWNPETQQAHEMTIPDDINVRRVELAPGKESLVLSVEMQGLEPETNPGRQTWLFDIATGEHEVLIDCESLVGNKECLSFLSPQGQYIAVSLDESIQIFDRRYHQVAIFKFQYPSHLWSAKMVWSPDETQLAFIQFDGELTLLRPDTQEIRVLQRKEERRLFLWQKEYLDSEDIRWLDDTHLAVIRDGRRTIPGNMEHTRERTWLQVIRVTDNQIWTLYENHCRFECTLDFDWTPITESRRPENSNEQREDQAKIPTNTRRLSSRFAYSCPHSWMAAGAPCETLMGAQVHEKWKHSI